MHFIEMNAPAMAEWKMLFELDYDKKTYFFPTLIRYSFTRTDNTKMIVRIPSTIKNVIKCVKID